MINLLVGYDKDGICVAAGSEAERKDLGITETEILEFYPPQVASALMGEQRIANMIITDVLGRDKSYIKETIKNSKLKNC